MSRSLGPTFGSPGASHLWGPSVPWSTPRRRRSREGRPSQPSVTSTVRGRPSCRVSWPLSRMSLVARMGPSMPSVGPKLYAADLECSSACPRALLGAARFTVQYVWAVGQDVSFGKCVLLSTSKSVRKSVKLWDVSGDGRPWSVELDVQDLGGHLDFTRWTRDGSLSKRVNDGAHGVAAVGVLPLGFQVKLCLVRGKYLPAGLHAVEASYVSASSLSAFRAAVVVSV